MVRKGAITKAGNAHCHHVLVQAAWSYRHPPKVSAASKARQQGQPATVLSHAWKTQQRLHRLYHHLAFRKQPKIAVVAVARELVGFLGPTCGSSSRRRRRGHNTHEGEMVEGCPEATNWSTFGGRYAVGRDQAESVCLEGGSSRRISFVPLRRPAALTGEYQQDHRRSRQSYQRPVFQALGLADASANQALQHISRRSKRLGLGR